MQYIAIYVMFNIYVMLKLGHDVINYAVYVIYLHLCANKEKCNKKAVA